MGALKCACADACDGAGPTAPGDVMERGSGLLGANAILAAGAGCQGVNNALVRTLASRAQDAVVTSLAQMRTGQKDLLYAGRRPCKGEVGKVSVLVERHETQVQDLVILGNDAGQGSLCDNGTRRWMTTAITSGTI